MLDFSGEKLKTRFLFWHDESESIFEAFMDEAELEKFISTPDGALCYDVSGKPSFEVKWENEGKPSYNRAMVPTTKEDKMTTTQVLRKLFLGIAAAFSEAAGEIEEVGTDSPAQEGEETTTTSKGKKGAKSTKEKTTKETKAVTGKGKKGKKDDEEMEDVDSPYNDDSSSDDPADFEDDSNDDAEEGDDDFAGMDEKKPTVEDLRAALVAYAQKHTKEKAYAVLAKFKAKKANEVKEADIPKAIAALKIK